MPRSQCDPSYPKPSKAKWTDSKIRFVLNEFLTEKEDGNLLGTTWKPVAYSNVHTRYNLAYPEDKMDSLQIKKKFSTARCFHYNFVHYFDILDKVIFILLSYQCKYAYNGMTKLKQNSGIGWVGGKIDMPAAWWKEVGEKDKDALQLRNKSFDFFDEMDVILHLSKPTGALRTGTSSTSRVKSKDNNQNATEIESIEVDAEGITQQERDLDDNIEEVEELDQEAIEEENSTEDEKAIGSDNSSLPTLDSIFDKDAADSNMINVSRSN